MIRILLALLAAVVIVTLAILIPESIRILRSPEYKHDVAVLRAQRRVRKAAKRNPPPAPWD